MAKYNSKKILSVVFTAYNTGTVHQNKSATYFRHLKHLSTTG